MVHRLPGTTTEYSDLDVDFGCSFVHGTCDWIDGLHEGRQASQTGAAGRRIIQFCRATQLSAREGREVLLDEI